MLIIARYDEVLCEKASKHSVVEACAKLDARYEEIDRIAQQALQTQTATNHLICSVSENQMRHESEMELLSDKYHILVDVQSKQDKQRHDIDILRQSFMNKVSVDRFESEIYNKANQDHVISLDHRVSLW